MQSKSQRSQLWNLWTKHKSSCSWSLIMFISLFTVPVRGYDCCWFIGDDFGSRSFEQYFQARKSIDYNGYVKANFDTMGFFSMILSDNPSLLGHLSSLLAQAMNCRINNKLLPLPKLIVVVPDDAFITALCGKDSNMQAISKPFSRLLNYIMTDFEWNVAVFKESLPAKSVRTTYPHFLWIQAPLHDNFLNNSAHYKFNKCLEEVCPLHNNCSTLMLKCVWCKTDTNLFIRESQRFTSDGYKTYWVAVGRMVRYLDSVLLKKQDKRKTRRRVHLLKKIGLGGRIHCLTNTRIHQRDFVLCHLLHVNCKINSSQVPSIQI